VEGIGGVDLRAASVQANSCSALLISIQVIRDALLPPSCGRRGSHAIFSAGPNRPSSPAKSKSVRGMRVCRSAPMRYVD
jgi:hypothetical protein